MEKFKPNLIKKEEIKEQEVIPEKSEDYIDNSIQEIEKQKSLIFKLKPETLFKKLSAYQSALSLLKNSPDNQAKLASVIADFERSILSRIDNVSLDAFKESKLLDYNYLFILNLLTRSLDQSVRSEAQTYLFSSLSCFNTETNPYDMSVVCDGLLVDNFVDFNTLKKLLAEMYTKKIINNDHFNAVLAMLFLRGGRSKEFAKFLIKILLTKAGLPFDDLLKAWENNAKIDFAENRDSKKDDIYEAKTAATDLGKTIIVNLVAINFLVDKEPGACKYLYENFGIRNFGRFSVSLWLDQYRNRDIRGPYGLIVSSVDDWNNSSYNDANFETYKDLQRNMLPVRNLRVLEVKSLPQLARFLNRIKKKYPLKPEFVIFSGHANDKEFFFGPGLYRQRNYKFAVDHKDFIGEAGERIKPYLDLFTDTTIICDFCSEDEAILPRVVAEATGSRVIYPAGKTSVKNFGLHGSPKGDSAFNVEYNFGVKTRIVDGKK